MDELTDEDYNRPLEIRLTLNLEAIEDALAEHYENDWGEVHEARYEADTRSVVIDVDLTLESGMSAGSWESRTGTTHLEVPFEVQAR